MSDADYEAALTALEAADPVLARITSAHGRPPRWRRDEGFATLVLLILEQQVSLASAKASFDRLAAAAGGVAPERILALGDDDLRAAGLSRQKLRYVRGLAAEVSTGRLAIRDFADGDDDAVRAALVALTGIGRWTADLYLLSALGRPDIWPAGDLALASAARDLLALEERPGERALTEIGARWRPWRSVAAQLLWHYYLAARMERRRGSDDG